jgi:hypothetical protein
MAPNIEKRTVSSAHAPDLDSDRLAVQELEPLLELGDDQGWFKERRSLIYILYDEITSLEWTGAPGPQALWVGLRFAASIVRHAMRTRRLGEFACMTASMAA